MSLKIQVFSFVFSFVYGFVFSFLLKINYNVLFMSRKLLSFFSNFLFMFDISLLYFLIIRYINEGILHFYFLILFFVGWFLGNFLLDIIVKK